MTTELGAVVSRVLELYPRGHAGDLSNARVTKLIYLTDWLSAISTKRQVTSIRWYFDNYGPYVDDVKKAVTDNPRNFDIRQTETPFGNRKTQFVLKKPVSPGVEHRTNELIKAAIEKTHKLPWGQFIKLVYSTYPVAASEQYTFLDLPTLATRYEEMRR